MATNRKEYADAGRSGATRFALVLIGACMLTPASAQDMGQVIADAAGIPQIPAFLPDKYSVATTEALPIDGLWLVSTIRKKIRIEQGRAYAVDSWLHLFTLKVMPDMVVMQNFRRTGAGQYAADDLPLMGPATMTLTGDGNLNVTVQGMFGPLKYGLTRLESQYPDELSNEIHAATGRTVTVPPPASTVPYPAPIQAPPAPPVSYPTPVAPAPAPPPAAPPTDVPADCRPIGIDPDTGQTICA